MATASLRARPAIVASAQNADARHDTLRLPPAVVNTGARGEEATTVTMRNVDFHMEGDITLRIHRMHGEMHPLKNGVVDFDDPLSYVTDISSAEVGMTGPDLTALMARVFNYKGAPLSNVRVEITPDGLRQRGTLHKGVDIGFDMTASVSLTPDGRIQLHPSKVHILGVNGLVLMKALGLSLEKMMDLSKAHGVTVKGNDLFLDAMTLLPPPQIKGRLTSVRLSSDELVQTIGTGTDEALATTSIDRAATNFMLYRGGTLHFGKLFMTDAEMLVVDADQTTPFDFDNPRYHRQLIAGHSKTLPDLGLEVWMPDARSVDRAVASRGTR